MQCMYSYLNNIVRDVFLRICDIAYLLWNVVPATSVQISLPCHAGTPLLCYKGSMMEMIGNCGVDRGKASERKNFISSMGRDL